MEVVIVPSADEAGRVVADIVAGALATGARTLGLATGSSPVGAYRELARRHREEGLSFAGIRAFLLDEYVGLAASHPQSYARVIRADFVDHVDLASDDVHGPDGATDDVLEKARRYDAHLRAAGPLDVQILGTGANGHLGFNEPGSSLASRTRVKTLTQQTRRDNARFFPEGEQVPQHVITQGLGTILEARHLVLVATGRTKAAAVAAAVEGPVSAFCPASVLQLHPHATVVVDELAARRLQLADYYRHVAAKKLPGQGF
ncbi:glucosamine-6-phosphate deaminase [Blastococcus aurantiacus]|uniref:Glucosamine-6-phosphate deaminase n=1 Tax=Blastococcus aurantiacus TaxID=1550231 RepID=A0A1G7NRL8_9ACTN|nr:glucosamine-6-phosphate deaminase [Blastococcus aurantiacus]SDF76577.1 glucosamine-6-phosphate deaminase [Blastococcus aurantiacus]